MAHRHTQFACVALAAVCLLAYAQASAAASDAVVNKRQVVPRKLLAIDASWSWARSDSDSPNSASMDSMPSTPGWATPTVAHGKNIGESSSEEDEESADDSIDAQMTSMGAGTGP